ncbi:Protein-disulfide isomerase [Candidatus Rhodobacter oscarellae]|uniref:Protein-disulfide isomerase n=1 Tax=Candidatus Rhodobacter oscarellae TaxID=1675527 RepID=A0A0J9GSF0_9RHOB|nr:DsbA family protein [Candidatus Rhodobacter lobularis]KMW56423.1 Protein-disulfide isomerase [Candidatus Rhodobacter lobularis]
MLTRLLSATALALVVGGPVAAFDMSAMSAEERDALRSEIRAYLLDNPEVLMEAIQVLESRQADQQAADDIALLQVNADALLNDPTSWVGGNPDGDVTIVEFLDYRCGYCKRAHPEVAELIASDGNIRLIVKEFPILGEESVQASRFALAVREVGGDEAYKAVNDGLMTMRGQISERSLRAMASDQGLDADAVMAAMSSEAVQRIIAQNRALGQRLSISGTPSFVFGDQMVRGYVPLDAMREIIAEERG